MVKISPRSYMVDTLHCTPYTVRSGSPAPPRPARGPAARPGRVPGRAGLFSFQLQFVHTNLFENVVQLTNWSHHPIQYGTTDVKLAIADEPTVLRIRIKAAGAAPATASAHVQCPCGHRG